MRLLLYGSLLFAAAEYRQDKDTVKRADNQSALREDLCNIKQVHGMYITYLNRLSFCIK